MTEDVIKTLNHLTKIGVIVDWEATFSSESTGDLTLHLPKGWSVTVPLRDTLLRWDR